MDIFQMRQTCNVAMGHSSFETCNVVVLDQVCNENSFVFRNILCCGSFHTKSPRIQKAPSMTISDFVENIHRVTLNCFMQACQISDL